MPSVDGVWRDRGLEEKHQLGRTLPELEEQPLPAWAMLRSILSRLGD